MNWVERLRHDPGYQSRALYLVLALGFVVRLWHLTAPIADEHSWNQTSTATVIRHYVEDGIDLLHPEWDILRAGPPPERRIEPEEAPLYHAAVALLARVFGPFEPLARLLSIAASLLGALFLFRLTQRLSDGPAALFAAVFYLFAPFGWYFGRTIMSDSWMLAMLIIAVERFDQWLREGSLHALFAAALAIALAGLFKPFALHIGIALALWQISARGWRSLLDWRLATAAPVAVLPPLAWVWWAAHVGSLGNVVHAGESVFTTKNLWGPLSLLWSGHFWFKLQARLFDQMATPLVTAFAVLSLWFAEARRQARPALFWLAGFLFYVALVRDGNQMHNYYQLPALPAFALLAALGLSALSRRIQGKWIALLLFAFLLMSALYVRSHFRLDLSSTRAGQIARLYSMPNDLVLVLDPGVDRKNQVIYTAHRRGWNTWSLKPGMIEQYRGWGAHWLVVVLDDQQRQAHPEWLVYAGRWRRITEENGDFGRRGGPHTIALFDLTRPAKKP